MSHLDDSDDSISTAANPTFDQLNFLLISRGYTSKPLLIPAGTSEDTIQALSNTIHSLLAQREEDIEVREQLSAQNRTLSATVERLKRAVDEEMRKSEDLERRFEGAKNKADAAVASQNAAALAHKQTQSDLTRARTELQEIKVAAHQYRLSSSRSSERLKSKLAETSLTALRSVVPSLRVATGAFSDYKGVRGALMQAQVALESSTDVQGSAGGAMLKEQLKELEEERAGLLHSAEVLKRMTTEAVNALRAVDRRLCSIEAEATAGGAVAASSTPSTVTSLKRKAHDAFGNDTSDGLHAISHEDLFPRAHPLRAAPTLSYVSVNPNKPATRSSAAAGSSVIRSSLSSAGSGTNPKQRSSTERVAATGASSANSHPAAVALQEAVSSLYWRLDVMDSRQAAAAAEARAAARTAKRARTFKAATPAASPAVSLSKRAIRTPDSLSLPGAGGSGGGAPAKVLASRTNHVSATGSSRTDPGAKRVSVPAMRQSRIGALRNTG
ncbi:hypothetical protein V8E36_003897 [Tilletia maclaganii]